MKVLLLCTSHNDLGLIKALRKMGHYIIATGSIENLPGQIWVDKFIKADYSNMELILEIAKREKIDRICPCCNDYGVYTAAYVAEQMHLPGYDSYETTLVLHNKDKFKLFAKEHGIQTPFAECFIQKEAAQKAILQMRLPVIVKPVDCSAGNGVSVVNRKDEIDAAVDMAFMKSRSFRIVVEPFLQGTQHGLCTFLKGRKVVAFCSNDEYSIINPFRVEIDTFPATDWEIYTPKLISQIEIIAKKLQLKDGIFHLQYIVVEGEPWIIEVMRRTVGNMYHVLGNEICGINWEYWEAMSRCGFECSSFPLSVKQQGYYAYKTILSNSNGEISNITIPQEYRKYVFNVFMLMKIGDTVTNYMSQPIGFLFMMFSSLEEMHNVLIKNYRNDLVTMRGKKNEQ